MIQTKCKRVLTPEQRAAKTETARKWEAANPDKRREYVGKYCAANRKAIQEAARKKYAKNAEKERRRCREWNQANPDRVKANGLAWRAANPDRVKEGNRAFREANPAYGRNWEGRNHEVRAAIKARRRSLLLAATCACCQTEDGKANMIVTYALARKLGLHVDHVKPLAKGGLHCLHNLQYLTPTENKRKGAKWQEAA